MYKTLSLNMEIDINGYLSYTTNDDDSLLYSYDKILIVNKDVNIYYGHVEYRVWNNTHKKWFDDIKIMESNDLIFYKNLTPLTEDQIKKIEKSLESNSGGKRKLKRSMKNKKNKK